MVVSTRKSNKKKNSLKPKFQAIRGGEGGICEYTRFETIKYIIDIGDLSCFSVSIT